MDIEINASQHSAAQQAFAIQALKAAGPVVLVDPVTFEILIAQLEAPLVIHAPARFLQPHRYLTNYRGLYFTAKSRQPLNLPHDAEIVSSKRIWLPNL